MGMAEISDLQQNTDFSCFPLLAALRLIAAMCMVWKEQGALSLNFGLNLAREYLDLSDRHTMWFHDRS